MIYNTMEKFLKDLDVFKKKGIVFYSTPVVIRCDDDGNYVYKKDGRLYKDCPKLPKFRGITLKTRHVKTCTTTMIPMGESYDLIGIDVDNKNNTMEAYSKICQHNGFNRNTFTVRTMQNGVHEYYRLTSSQKEDLKKLKSLDGQIFSLDIDVKYTNQFLFGPSILGKQAEFSYTISKDIDLIILPDFLFNEIVIHVKNCNKQKIGDDEEIVEETQKDVKKVEDENIQNLKKTIDIRLEKYLECLKEGRFSNYPDWIKIGAGIFNEGGTVELWDKFSKKSEKYDKTCNKKWDTFKTDHDVKATLKTIRDMARLDNPEL